MHTHEVDPTPYNQMSFNSHGSRRAPLCVAGEDGSGVALQPPCELPVPAELPPLAKKVTDLAVRIADLLSVWPCPVLSCRVIFLSFVHRISLP